MRIGPGLPDISPAIVQVLQRQAYVLLVVFPSGQVGALEIVEGFLGHISLRLEHVDLAIGRVFIRALSVRGTLLQRINLLVGAQSIR